MFLVKADNVPDSVFCWACSTNASITVGLSVIRDNSPMLGLSELEHVTGACCLCLCGTITKLSDQWNISSSNH